MVSQETPGKQLLLIRLQQYFLCALTVNITQLSCINIGNTFTYVKHFPDFS